MTNGRYVWSHVLVESSRVCLPVTIRLSKKSAEIFHTPVIFLCSEIGEDLIITGQLGGSLNCVLLC